MGTSGGGWRGSGRNCIIPRGLLRPRRFREGSPWPGRKKSASRTWSPGRLVAWSVAGHEDAWSPGRLPGCCLVLPGRCLVSPGRCLVAAWSPPGRRLVGCLVAAWSLPGRHLVAAWLPPGRCLVATWLLPGYLVATWCHLVAWCLPGKRKPPAGSCPAGGFRSV